VAGQVSDCKDAEIVITGKIWQCIAKFQTASAQPARVDVILIRNVEW
jgi:hypothetical protein